MTSTPSSSVQTHAPGHALGFDAQHPPDPKLIDACVHCGFCLATCPSYRVLGTEMDSPRGRIYAMEGIHSGETPLNAQVSQHFDSCLGCLACVTTCPSGVQYDRLIANTRPQVNRNVPRSLPETLLRQFIFSLFPYPQRLRRLLPVMQWYQRFGLQKLVRSTKLLPAIAPPLAALEALLPPITPAAFRDAFPPQTQQVGKTWVVPAQGKRRYRVGMVLGCVQRLFNPSLNLATLNVLQANGCEVVIPQTQGCCGALSHHQGQISQAEDFARQMLDSFADLELDAVLINASGCGHTLKEYGVILAEDPHYAVAAQAFVKKVKDIQEFLAEVGLTTPLAPLAKEPLAIAYQDACHMLHGQKIYHQPRQLLRQIPGVSLREPLDGAICCGSAGVYNIFQPEVAAELGRQKVQNLLATGADIIASSNIGCFVQISHHLQEQGKSVPVLHPLELLDRSIQSAREQS